MIVGRNPQALDEAGVARAAIESLAENFSDGVVAPVLWIVVGGLAGGALYKAINTADSMIGHNNAATAPSAGRRRGSTISSICRPRVWPHFGSCSAALTRAPRRRDAARAVRRDATRHRSPNAGWPEAAMAGALGLKLAGPRVYGDAGR